MKLILGGPGCGKTTRLLSIVQAELASGVPSEEIAFVAFTRAAAEEARRRAAEDFGLDAEVDLPWFRTIHSLTYKQLEMTRDEIMTSSDWREFAELIGQPISGYYESDASTSATQRPGDRLLRVVDYSATTMTSLWDAYHEVGQELDWWAVRQFDEAFRRFKGSVAKLDFTDMLLSYLDEGKPIPVRVAVIDEAQDLTAAQWAVVRRAFAGAKRVYIGGDDDQAIYRWAGADVDQFLDLTAEPEILRHSHRLPRSVFKLSQRITSHIRHRYHKPYAPSDREGRVEWHNVLESVPFGQEDPDRTWLLLARNGYLLEQVEVLARAQGIPYARRDGPVAKPGEVEALSIFSGLRSGKLGDLNVHQARVLFKALGRPRPALRELERYTPSALGVSLDRSWYVSFEGIPQWRLDYYLECLRNGEDLTRVPRVRIETIHGTKGAEADCVLLILDVSFRTAESFEADPDNEHRVFYVGATRAREELHILSPQTRIHYPGIM